VGGFGLTGFITSVELRLRKIAGSAIVVRKQPVANLVEAVERMETDPEADVLYSWHDCNRKGHRFGAGYVYTGRHTTRSVPEEFSYRRLTPERRAGWHSGRLARFTTRMATRVYGWSQRWAREERVLPLAAATFPINGKEVYFRMFGRAGLREYQVLIPRPRWAEAAHRLAELVQAHGVPIGLASLKLFRGSLSYLNFDGSGVCLALDAPARARTLQLFADLDALTLCLGGLVNLSKDSRLGAAFVAKVYPGYDRFKADLKTFDPKGRFDSALRRRLDV